MKHFFILSLVLVSYIGQIFGQELNVQFSINTPKLQTTDPKVFETLKTAVVEMMNNEKWTDVEYQTNERIEVTITLTISAELSETRFRGELGISASRPIFGTDYNTTLLTHLDKAVTFDYEQFQPLQYSDEVYTHNLVSILSFYAHLIIGLDNDSFEKMGGEKHFRKSQAILNTVSPSAAATYPGWRPNDSDRNRYWLISSILDPRVSPLREAFYDYHRMSLDLMHRDVEAAKVVMLGALSKIKTVNKAYPNSMVITVFVNSKSNEIIDIYKRATPKQKTKVYQIMVNLDAANASKYQPIKQ